MNPLIQTLFMYFMLNLNNHRNNFSLCVFTLTLGIVRVAKEKQTENAINSKQQQYSKKILFAFWIMMHIVVCAKMEETKNIICSANISSDEAE